MSLAYETKQDFASHYNVIHRQSKILIGLQGVQACKKNIGQTTLANINVYEKSYLYKQVKLSF